jgi:hypothetical protein
MGRHRPNCVAYARQVFGHDFAEEGKTTMFNMGKLESRPASLLADPRRRQGVWSAKLTVDETDPYFFDHPLDHVPGMLLLTGNLDLINVAESSLSQDLGQRVSMSVSFRAFAELQRDILVWASEMPSFDPGVQWTFGSKQEDRTLVEGWVSIRDHILILPSTPKRSNISVLHPASADLVHRHRPENILIGTPRVDGHALKSPIMPLSPTHLLARRNKNFRGIEELIEAARQFVIFHAHAVDGYPADTQMILSRISAEVPRYLPRDWPVAFKFIAGGKSSSGYTLRFELVGDSEDASYGQFEVSGRAASPKSYRRIRGLMVSS